MTFTAIVTGAGSGIGLAITEYLASRAVKVYACSLNNPSSRAYSSTLLDIRNEYAVGAWLRSIAENEDHVDMLINNAAILGERAAFEQLPLALWHEVVTTNVLGTVTVTRATLPLLGRQRPSTIVNVSSIMGRFGRAGWSMYSTSKFAIEGLTQAFAQEFFTRAVRAVALHPARINTSLRRRAYGDEQPFPTENIDNLLLSIYWLLTHPDAPVSGLTLSSDDFWTWSGSET
jgi:3-oxoacyl-[acyl-carrier protein] reductase